MVLLVCYVKRLCIMQVQRLNEIFDHNNYQITNILKFINYLNDWKYNIILYKIICMVQK